MNWQEILEKKIRGIQGVKLEKWFLSYFHRLNYSDEEKNTICKHIPSGKALLEEFNNRLRLGGDFFTIFMQDALKSDLNPKKEEPTPKPLSMLKKRGDPDNYKTYDLTRPDGRFARINEHSEREAFLELQKHEAKNCGQWPKSKLLSTGKTAEDLEELKGLRTTSGSHMETLEFEQKTHGVVGYPSNYE